MNEKKVDEKKWWHFSFLEICFIIAIFSAIVVTIWVCFKENKTGEEVQTTQVEETGEVEEEEEKKEEMDDWESSNKDTGMYPKEKEGITLVFNAGLDPIRKGILKRLAQLDKAEMN